MCVYQYASTHYIWGWGLEQARIQDFILEGRPVLSRGLGLSKSPANPGQRPMGGGGGPPWNWGFGKFFPPFFFEKKKKKNLKKKNNPKKKEKNFL